MPFNSEKRSKEAQKRPRDRDGHFIPLKPKVKVSGQANIFADLIKTEDGNDKGSSWMTLTINHPFRKIIDILQQIKDKQATTVALKFTIPLVALPIAILLAFQFGRYQTSCQEYYASQIGSLQNVTIEKSVAPDNWFLKSLTYLPFTSGTYNKKVMITQPIIVKNDNTGILIDNTSGLDLKPFTQSNVLVVGTYNSCTQTQTLDSPQNISNY